jgi:hypothetical protein
MGRTGEMRSAANVLAANLTGGDHFGDLDVDGRVILKAVVCEHMDWM